MVQVTTDRKSCIERLAMLIEEIKPGLCQKVAISPCTRFEEIHFDSLDFIRLLSILSELKLISGNEDFSGITDIGQLCNILNAEDNRTGE